jgi:hypothetical protein
MLIKFKGENYYKTSEVARLAGISRSTLLRWFYDGIIKNQSLRDRRGWRLFTEAEIKKVEEEFNKMKNKNQLSQYRSGRFADPPLLLRGNSPNGKKGVAMY